MVGDHAHRHLGVGAFVVTVAGEGLDAADHPGEDVGVVIALFALENGAEAFKAHSGVDAALRERLEQTVGLAVELHKDEVPDLDDEGVVLVDELRPGNGGLFRFVAQVDVDFAAGSAGAGLAHFPEVVVLVAEEDLFGGDVAQPGLAGLFIEGGAVAFGALEDGDVKVFRVDLEDLGQKFPGPVDGLVLEVVAEAPVAQHLEHRVVVGVVSDGFEVVVLSADPQAFLAVGHPGGPGGGVAEEDILELVHPRIGEHQGRVVLDDHRSGRNDGMALRSEEVQELFSDFFGSHNWYRLCMS